VFWGLSVANVNFRQFHPSKSEQLVLMMGGLRQYSSLAILGLCVS
jgi:hypothetical protein